MSFSSGLINLFPKLQNQQVFSHLSKFPVLGVSGAGNHASKAFLFADIYRSFEVKDEYSIPSPIIWIVNDTAAQEDVARSCQEWFGPNMLVRKPKIHKWVLTPHAAQRMIERKISVMELEEVFQSPDLIQNQGPKYILARSFSERKDNLIAAVLIEKVEKNLWLVITVMVDFQKK